METPMKSEDHSATSNTCHLILRSSYKRNRWQMSDLWNRLPKLNLPCIFTLLPKLKYFHQSLTQIWLLMKWIQSRLRNPMKLQLAQVTFKNSDSNIIKSSKHMLRWPWAIDTRKDLEASMPSAKLPSCITSQLLSKRPSMCSKHMVLVSLKWRNWNLDRMC